MPVIDRRRRWVGVSFGLHLGTCIIYPALICGCCFQIIALPVSSLPVVWGVYSLVTSQTIGERILGYINAFLALGWLYLVWESNLRFAFA